MTIEDTILMLQGCGDEYKQVVEYLRELISLRKYSKLNDEKRLAILPYASGTKVYTASPFADGVMREGYITNWEFDGDRPFAFFVDFEGLPITSEFIMSDIGNKVFIDCVVSDSVEEGLR